MPEEEKTSIQPTGAVMDVQAPKTANNAPEPADSVNAPSPPATPDPPVEQPKTSPLAVPLGTKTPHHSSRPIVTIICAVLVAAILAGLTVYAFQKSNASNAPSTAANPNAVTVKASDVDQVSNDVDASLQKTDDTKDLTATDLNDTTLGL